MKYLIEYNMHILILLILPVISILFVVFLIIFLIKIIPNTQPKTYNEIMGEVGENSIENTLSKIDGYFYILRNLEIPNKERKAEIDLILLHEKGLYVFESKNFTGWIYGSQNANYWLQTFKQSKYKFYNPIRQNETHIKALISLLHLTKENKPNSYIVFGDEATLKKLPSLTTEYTICQQYDLFSTISEDLNGKAIMYSHETLAIYYNFLKQYTSFI